MAIGRSKPQPEQPQNANKRKESWDDGVAEASPKRALYHSELRTGGYINQNLVENYVEFWAALRVDSKADTWRIMHYMLFDLNQEDGIFKAEVVEAEVNFMQAVAHLSRSEYLAEKGLMHKVADMEQKYPAATYPELRLHYYDIPHYKDAANVEGIAFDAYNDPYRRIEGKVFADATFRRAEVKKSILAVENPQQSAAAGPVMEAGILSDIFSTSSARAASLEGIIRMGQCLSVMDEFATQIAAFYLSVQKMLKQTPSLDAIEGLAAQERKTVLRGAEQESTKDYEQIVDDLLPRALDLLDTAKEHGVHVEPFEKFVAECEVYVHMLNASIRLPQLEKSLYSASQSDVHQIVEIQQSMQKAQKKFIELGGGEEQVDQLKAWVANTEKTSVPTWLPGFLTRYYTSRSKVMANVQARNARMRDVTLMAASVKPPLESPQAEAALPAPQKKADNGPNL